jgi:hypothetical protein
VQILHLRIQRRELASMVGKPGSALIEQDQAERTSETEAVVSPPGVLPPIDEIRDEARNPHKIAVSPTNHLKGKRDATISRVPDLAARRLLTVRLHRSIVRHPFRPRSFASGTNPRWLAKDAYEYAAALRNQAHTVGQLDRQRIRAWCEWIEEWARRHDPITNPTTIIGRDELEPTAPSEHQ